MSAVSEEPEAVEKRSYAQTTSITAVPTFAKLYPKLQFAQNILQPTEEKKRKRQRYFVPGTMKTKVKNSSVKEMLTK